MVDYTVEKEKTILSVMKERHSVKHYQSDVKMTKEEIDRLLEMATSAPSAWNLQHWRFLVVEEQKKKEELLPIAYGQKQIIEASAVIAILGDLEANREAEGIYQGAVDSGLMSNEIKETLVNQINQAYSRGKEFGRDAAFLNSSLAAMQLMLAAKEMGYDTCPIGGFNKEAFVKQFNVPERFAPVMLITVGKALKEAYPSSRKPVEQVAIYNSF